jgi:hypothetical protein
VKYAVEMGSESMIYIPSSIKFSPGIRKLVGRYTDRQQGDLISLRFSFQFKESRL